MKTFNEGEKVIVLIKDSTNHLLSRWQVGKIVKVKSPYSYLVELPSGAVAHIHVDKLRQYTARAHAVILQQDKDFGTIHSMPPDISDNKLPSQRIDRSTIAHLSNDDQGT